MDAALPESTRRSFGARAYLGYVLFLLLQTDILKVSDTAILGVTIEPLKPEFALSDTQLGLLAGSAFACVYSIVTIPVARWAVRGHHRNIVSLSLATWSAPKAACGAAGNFTKLVAAHFLAGPGESGAVPTIRSLVSDFESLPQDQLGNGSRIRCDARGA